MSGVGPAYGAFVAVCAPAGVRPPGATTAASRATAARKLRIPNTSPRGCGLLSVDGAHVGIAVSGGGARRCDLVDPAQVVGVQLYVDRTEVLLEVANPLRAGDRDDVIAAREQPCQRKLSRRAALLTRDLAHLVDEVEVLLEVLALEARVVAAEVTLLQVVERGDLSGEETAA